MQPFKYLRASDAAQATKAVAKQPATAQFIAGGTTMLDLMKLDVLKPELLIDVSRLPLSEIKAAGGGLLIGAMVRNSTLAEHSLVREHYPILSQALLSGASPQLRNMATVGGNILQRSRCPYFRERSLSCNKRQPGSGCPALEGYSRMHAIFGVSEHCISAHPSDMCVALTALDAILHVQSAQDRQVRKIPIATFYLPPGQHPDEENLLEPGELITAVEIPGSHFSAASHYLKVRDRDSFSFALVSVAACLNIRGGYVQEARIVLGGVATKPWRVEASEVTLIGKRLSPESINEAAEAALAGANVRKHNRFKIELTRRSVVRAIQLAAGAV